MQLHKAQLGELVGSKKNQEDKKKEDKSVTQAAMMVPAAAQPVMQETTKWPLSIKWDRNIPNKEDGEIPEEEEEVDHQDPCPEDNGAKEGHQEPVGTVTTQAT
ncbi:hypothetical protein C0J50_9961 [Silurus asotus]|uniref:GAGE domain-containing protein n=1 Tax=Silurus asotus TaxID=30991 RepID=A0AAD5F985_SILAS|nr:hypothetical protein C0J50_9961 [Silurus asotus]